MAVDLPPPLLERRRITETRFGELRGRVVRSEAPAMVGDFASVYVTGSYGRGEASSRSDLDLFVLCAGPGPGVGWDDRLKSMLAGVTADLGFPEFTDEGKYLKPHAVDDLVGKLGGRDDDYENLFTARMLLLLESRPLLGDAVYERAIDG